MLRRPPGTGRQGGIGPVTYFLTPATFAPSRCRDGSPHPRLLRCHKQAEGPGVSGASLPGVLTKGSRNLTSSAGSLRERSYDVSAVGEGEASRGEGPSPLEAHPPSRPATTRGDESEVVPPTDFRPARQFRLLFLRGVHRGAAAPLSASAGRILPAPPTTLISGCAPQPHPPASDKTAASAARTEYASRLSQAVGRGKNRGGRVSLPPRSAFTVTQC